jgi:hypothetical protein
MDGRFGTPAAPRANTPYYTAGLGFDRYNFLGNIWDLVSRFNRSGHDYYDSEDDDYFSGDDLSYPMPLLPMLQHVPAAPTLNADTYPFVELVTDNSTIGAPTLLPARVLPHAPSIVQESLPFTVGAKLFAYVSCDLWKFGLVLTTIQPRCRSLDKTAVPNYHIRLLCIPATRTNAPGYDFRH